MGFEAVDRMLSQHVRHIGTRKNRWNALRAAVRSEFWSGVAGIPALAALESSESTALKTEINDLVGRVSGLLGSLFYSEIKVQARASPFGAPASPGASESVQALIELWLERAAVRQAVTAAVAAALVSDEAALVFLPTTSAAPLDGWRVQSVLPEDAVWDRSERSETPMRIGAIVSVDRASAEARVLGIPSDEEESKPARVLHLYDLHADTYQVLLLRDENTVDRELSRQPIPFRVGAEPVAGVVALVIEPDAKHPLSGSASLVAQWRVSAERNTIGSVAATQAIRTAARKLFVSSTSVPEKADRERMLSDKDGEVVAVSGSVESQAIAAWMAPPPMDEGLREAWRRASSSRGDVRGTGAFVGGEQQKYSTATEIEEQASYTATTIGRMGQAIDDAVSRLASVFVAAVAPEVGDRLVFTRGRLSFVLSTFDLVGVEWILRVSDVSGSPRQQAQRRELVTQAIPLLSASMQVIAQGGDPRAVQMARATYREVHAAYGLPDSMSLDAIEAAAAAEAAMMADAQAMAKVQTAPFGAEVGDGAALAQVQSV